MQAVFLIHAWSKCSANNQRTQVWFLLDKVTELAKIQSGGVTFWISLASLLGLDCSKQKPHTPTEFLWVYFPRSGCFVSHSSQSCSHQNISLQKVRLHHQDCARQWSNFGSQDSLFSTNVLRLSQRLCSFHFPFFCFLKQFRDNRFGDLGQQSKKGCRLHSSLIGLRPVNCAKQSPRMNLLLYVL